MEDKKLKICELYVSGMKISDICKECKCSTNTISKIIKENNIPSRSKPKNTNKDLSKFYELDNPILQYWIGYICADGGIQYSVQNRIYVLSLYSKDEEIVNNFKNYFGDIVSIHHRKNGMHQAYINSKELCEFFINKLNITPNKALTLNPNIEFSKEFILGYFDGDGAIMNSNEERTRYECNFTSGSKVFLEKIKEVLDKQGIYSVFYEHSDCNAYKIRIDRKEDSEKLYKWMYEDHPICLSRKLNNFVALYGNIE